MPSSASLTSQVVVDYEKERAGRATTRSLIVRGCSGHNRNNTVHGSTEIPVRVLNSSKRTRSDRLIVGIKGCVETAIEGEHACLRKFQRKCFTGLNERVDAATAGGIERI